MSHSLKTSSPNLSDPINEATNSILKVLDSSWTDLSYFLDSITGQSSMYLFLKIFSLYLFHCYHLSLPNQRPPQSSPVSLFHSILYENCLDKSVSCTLLFQVLTQVTLSFHFLIHMINTFSLIKKNTMKY